MQVLKVTAAVLISMLSIWVMLRLYGHNQQYKSYDHPLMLKSKPWIIAWGGELEDGPSHSREAFKGAVGQKDVFLAINLQMNADKNFYAIPPDFKVGTKRIDLTQLSDSLTHELDLGNGKNPMSLEQVLNEFAQTPILIWVRDNIENIDLRLDPILKKYKAHQHLLIQSEYDNVIKSIKSLIPDLLFGTGVGQRVRLLMLSSIGVESVTSIDGDFFISPLFEGKVKINPVEIKNEVLRRQKVFILGPLNDLNENSQALSYGATGFLTSYPRDLKKKLNSMSQAL